MSGQIVLIGGAGFIGSNLAQSFLAGGEDVLVVDNLSRAGVEQNLAWLQQSGPGRLRFRKADVRDSAAMVEVVAEARAVFDFAAQTAVTTSLDDPVNDFDVNARGALNVLEAVRQKGGAVPVILASTNKVYGDLADVALTGGDGGYAPCDAGLRAYGLNESRPLAFRTPYGCSKGAADQYVLDYAHSFGLPTAVLRMSCIYGPRQFGTEDQGWVAHFALRALADEPITFYGDGRQVRDVLFVDDAVAAYRAVLAHIESVRGRAFNLGGGPANAVSLNGVVTELGHQLGRPVRVQHEAWRPADQLYFVADTRALAAAVGWRARVGWRDGLSELLSWLAGSRAPRGVTLRAMA